VFNVVVVPLTVKSPSTVTLPDTVWLPVKANVEPSNVKFASPFIVPPPVAVKILLSVLLVILPDMLSTVPAVSWMSSSL
jgi:hypothetical protein